MLERSFLEVPEPSAADEGESYGILHEALRPLARRCDRVTALEILRFRFEPWVPEDKPVPDNGADGSSKMTKLVIAGWLPSPILDKWGL